jgi:hypothetical protein
MSGGQPIAAMASSGPEFRGPLVAGRTFERVQRVDERCKEAAIVLMYSSTIKRKSPQCRVTMDYTAADLGA